MEDHNVKFQKSLAARSALALVAAGSAMALTACGAGQITQTSSQLPAVNGTNGNATNVSVRDASLIIGKDGKTYVKFTAGNIEDNGGEVKLDSVKVDGKDVSLSGETSMKPNCNLVADTPESIKKQKKAGENTCNVYASFPAEGLKDVYMAGSKPGEFKFNTGTVEVNLPVIGEQPKSGEGHRNASSELVDEQEAKHEGHH